MNDKNETSFVDRINEKLSKIEETINNYINTTKQNKGEKKDV